jgi:hypothetical protein
MKNLHLVYTDNPSRLIFNPSHKSFCIQKELNGMYINDGKVSGADFWGLEKALNNGFKPQHLYITNGEEIKEGDWIYDISSLDYNPLIHKATNIDATHLSTKDSLHARGLICTARNLKGRYKKIILTTDQDLIEDGVQAIDDEFLEWFVKNPSCEFVETVKVPYFDESGYSYLVGIPQEEPKPLDNLEERFKRDMSMVVMPLDNENIPEEPKQVICRDKFDRVIQDGYYVDVQNDGVHKVYRKEDSQLYFKPYGEEERVSNYFSNDLILIPYSTKLIMDLKKEIADKKQEESEQESYICPHTKIQCDDECCVSAEDCHIISSLATGMVDCKEPKQETPAYVLISNYYGKTKTKRSNVPLINHIDEGIEILKGIGADEDTIEAYCLHPILQSDEEFNKNLTMDFSGISTSALLLAVEYRRVANSYLSTDKIENFVGFTNEKIKQMLYADKIQNEKDFALYHEGKHDRSKELREYFNNWLNILLK